MPRGKLLGRIIGTDEEEQDTPIEEEAMEDYEEDTEGESEESVTLQPKSRASKKPAKVAIGEDEASDTENREDWINEYEGQLTLDVYQTKDSVVIKSTIAGVKSENLDITIANDMVTIKGERKKDEEVREEDYFYQECYWGPFSRSIILPVDIDVEGVTADLKDGILTVELPKAAKAKTKKIKVRGTE